MERGEVQLINEGYVVETVHLLASQPLGINYIACSAEFILIYVDFIRNVRIYG